MDEEKIISGYCRQIDRSRMVTLECTGEGECSCDCCYGSCVYQPNCPIAREIDEWLAQMQSAKI